jgi:hypothetical protein
MFDNLEKKKKKKKKKLHFFTIRAPVRLSISFPSLVTYCLTHSDSEATPKPRQEKEEKTKQKQKTKKETTKKNKKKRSFVTLSVRSPSLCSTNLLLL